MPEKKSLFKKIIRSLKNLLGLRGYGSTFKHYIDLDNARSGIIVSSIVMLLELYMIFYVVVQLLSGSTNRSMLWIVQHLSSYIILFAGSLWLCIFSYRFLNGKTCNRIMGKFMMMVFALFCLSFGIYISYLDYLKGEHVLSFIAMEVFVMGLMIWRPLVSLSILTSSFLIFYFLCDFGSPASYATRMNLFTVWLAISITTVSRFHQKVREIKKKEQIENMNAYLGEVAVTDEATGIGNLLYFRNKVGELRTTNEEDFLSRVFIYIDIVNFKSYNERYGFDEGTRFLSSAAHTILYTFPNDPVARFSDDHFVVFPKREGVEEKINAIRKKIVGKDREVRLGLKAGAYVPKAPSCHTNTACDFARYACESIQKKYDVDYCEYTTASAEDFARKQYIINNIDKAISNGYIHVYYQPVVFSATRKLAGFEALARWIDPKYGFLPPNAFIPVLEEYRQIHKLDECILRQVCRDILEAPEQKVPTFPISVNFSKIDFEIMDLEKILEESIEKQNIDKSLIHIEVTESALSSDDEKLKTTLHTLKAKNYSLWLDDFGSGYSGLNILKEYEFDVMKIDMAFLKDFSSTPKTRPILKNIVSLATDIGMKTLCEGVETEEAFDFLRQIGCERIQGYLFGKPMPKDEVIQKIKNGDFNL